MSYVQPPRMRRGKFLRARRINYDEDGIRRCQLVGGDGVFVSQGIDGMSASADVGTAAFWIRLIDSDGLGKYSWQGIAGARGTGGAVIWTDIGGVTGTLTTNGDPAIEANGVATLPAGTRVEVEREERSGQVRFQMDTCA